MRRDVAVAAAGAVVGSLLTVGAAALVWPRDDAATAGSVPVAGLPTAATASPSSSPSSSPSVSASPSPSLPGDLPTVGSGATGDSHGDDANSDSGDDDGDPDAPPLPNAAPAGRGPLPRSAAVSCPTPTVRVATAGQLRAALAHAAPGDAIGLADGTYTGEFTARASGTRSSPVYLCGSQQAVLDGGDVEGGYVLHLDGARYWRLVGFTVTDGQKGVMADSTRGSVIQGLTVTRIGDEAVHLRDDSTDNVVRDNTISDTGLRRDKFGEGVYVGTAVSNWCSYTDCRVDRSDRNVVVHNTITGVRAEAVDIKEGTTGGVLADNTFDGSQITGADSWVDVKGNNWLIEDNRGSHAPEDGFQTHQILDGWGDHNRFAGNHADVDGPGVGIALQPVEANVLTCTNTVADAADGLSNTRCSR